MTFSLLLLFALTAVSPDTRKPVDNAWSILEDGVQHSNSDKRASAVHALGILERNARAERLAEKALEDNNPQVRIAAANAIAEMKDVAAGPKLRIALDDKEIKVVIAAANALYALKDPAAYQVYYALLTGSRKTSEGLLQSQLDRLKDRKALEKIAFETGIGFIPYGGMGWDAWKQFTQGNGVALQAAAAEKLATDPDPKSAHALEDYTTDKRWQIRAAVANALAKRGDPRVQNALIPLLEDDNSTVRYAAAAAIVRLSGARRVGRRAVNSATASRSTKPSSHSEHVPKPQAAPGSP
ncbi:MAG: HEAT repeat domain-containing protein [Acidobacteriaceae bacterium]|nr:HEAT repeat domain-containing protein [Acidobacteriaceae bacterium]